MRNNNSMSNWRTRMPNGPMAQIQGQLGPGNRLAWRLASTGEASGLRTADKKAVFAFLNCLGPCLAVDQPFVDVTVGAASCHISRTGATYQVRFQNGGGNDFTGGPEDVLRVMGDLAGQGQPLQQIAFPDVVLAYEGPDMQPDGPTRRLLAQLPGADRQTGGTTFLNRLQGCLAVLDAASLVFDWDDPEEDEHPVIHVAIGTKQYGIENELNDGVYLVHYELDDPEGYDVTDEYDHYHQPEELLQVFAGIIARHGQQPNSQRRLECPPVRVTYAGPDMQLDPPSLRAGGP